MVDISSLRKQIKGIVLVPGDEGYEESLKRWAINAERRAGYVVQITSAADASATVKFSRENKIPLTVRGGGHSVSGASSSDGGLIVDLSKMRKVKVIPEKKLLVAQGGALIADLDEAAAEYGLATVSGTVNNTGIGGLTLGGGKGFLTGQLGLAIDNLIETEVILASGEIVRANARENPDLFWALRGAGPNFGIVTEFTFQAYDQGDVWSGIIIYTPDKIPAVVEAVDKYYKTAPANSALAVGIGHAPGSIIPTILISPFYNGSEADGRQNFKAFFDVGPEIEIMETRPYNELFLPFNPSGIHRYQKSSAIAQLTLPITNTFAEYIGEFVSHIGFEDRGVTMISLEYFPNEKTVSVPRDATAFYQRGEWIDYHVMIGLGQRTELDGWVAEWAQRLVDKIVELEKADDGIAEDLKTGGQNGYWYAGDGVDRKQLFGTNYERLRVLKKKYDPDMIFHSWFPITPAN